jgi:hypothetical protein
MFSGATADALMAICSLRSISRTFSAYSSRRLTVVRPEVGAQPRHAAGQRIENALIALPPCGTLFRRRAVTEHPLEDHLRVQLHWQR